MGKMRSKMEEGDRRDGKGRVTKKGRKVVF